MCLSEAGIVSARLRELGVCVGGLQISTGSWRGCVGDDIVLVERRLTDVLCVSCIVER